jgi:hypothetical protein
MKNQLVDIFKEAEGKRFTYLYLDTPLGLSMQPVIENLEIEEISDEIIFLKGATGDVDEFVRIPLNEIDDIVKVDKDDYRLENADAEYFVRYKDGTELYIEIVYVYEAW